MTLARSFVLLNLDLLKLSLCKITEMESLWCSSEPLVISLDEVICARRSTEGNACEE